jgi:periplasmic protein TonB
MAAPTKESASSPSAAQAGTPAAQNSGTAASPRTDAIGVEIPVTLYASRYSAAGRGMSKTPPPVREETRTVIVFAQGAVVRLSAAVSVGEMVVLTNQQTGADVLCRVGAVKTQAGIQNYVDLEFTQRAPGFWDAKGPSARIESPADEPVARNATPVPAIPAPKQPPVSRSPLGTESVPPVAAATTIPAHTAPANPISPIAPLSLEPARPTPPRPVVPSTSNPVLSAGGGLRSSQPGLSTLTSDRPDLSKPAAPASRTGLWVAIAAVAVAGIVGGGFVLSRRGQSALPTSAITVAAPSVPAQPATPEPADGPQTPAAADSTPTATAAPVQAPTWLPDSPRHEQTQAENPPQPTQQAQQAQPTQQARQTQPPPPPAQPAPRRSTIPVGNLATPVVRAPVMVSSSEPPPVLLTTQDNGAAEGVLRTGELSGVSHVEAPTAFAAAEALPQPGQPAQPVQPAHPAATSGKLELPKLLSSTNPLYPPAARAQALEGVVMLDASVDATGKVTDVKVISGPLLLRQAAIDALRKWKFQPARLNGQPTAAHTSVNVRFALR